MLREGRTTRLTPISKSGAGIAVDPLLQAVRDAAAADFDVLGEIGRGGGEMRVYLAREASTGALVVLRLERDPAGNEFTLDLLRRLDQSVPATLRCLSCARELGGWMRFCTHCGADLSSADDGAGSAAQRSRMLVAVREAVADEYDVLGEMESKEGQGVVFFARELASGEIVALRLQREADESYSVGRTMALKPFAEELGVLEPPPLPRPHPSPPAPAPGSAPPASPPPQVPAPVSNAGPALAGKLGRKPILIGAGVVLAVSVAALLFSVPAVDRPQVTAPQSPVPATPQALVPLPEPTSSDTVNEAPTPAAPVRPAARAGGRVRITGLPKGARVTIDGRLRSARSVELPAGRHTVSIEASGYAPYEHTLELRNGETIAWQPELVPLASAAPSPATPAEQRPPVSSPAPVDTSTHLASCSTNYTAKHWPAAFDACTREANAGQAQAQYLLGSLFDNGRGTKRNTTQARFWYEKAAQQGQKDAAKRIEAMELQAAKERKPF